MSKPTPCEDEEHMTIGTNFGQLECFDCGTEVILERGIWGGNLYVMGRDAYFRRKKTRDESSRVL